MKITIIGEIFFDEIHPYRGKKQTGFGGILYNLIALANLADSSTTLIPISFLWTKHFPKVKKICAPYPNILLSGIIPSDKGTETACLTYSSWDKRTEEITLYHPPIPFRNIKRELDSDAILINFTALQDVSLSTLRKIRKSSNALIMIDLHSFPSKINSKKIRYSHPVPNWRDWLSCADIIQGNEMETSALLGVEINNENNWKIIHRKILETSVQIVITTLGEKGTVISYTKKRKIIFEKIPAYPIKRIVDTTGSGDVFTSAFLWKYLNTNNPYQSAKYANQIAALNCQLHGLEELSKLPKSHSQNK
jgi:hypothetical protein